MIPEQKCQIASDGSLSYSDEFVWEKHTSGVGTSTYAAPEQLEGTLYNYKVVNELCQNKKIVNEVSSNAIILLKIQC